MGREGWEGGEGGRGGYSQRWREGRWRERGRKRHKGLLLEGPGGDG